jgi:hypothetical protein
MGFLEILKKIFARKKQKQIKPVDPMLIAVQALTETSTTTEVMIEAPTPETPILSTPEIPVTSEPVVPAEPVVETPKVEKEKIKVEKKPKVTPAQPVHPLGKEKKTKTKPTTPAKPVHPLGKDKKPKKDK